MANGIEFILSLKDLMSRKMQQAAVVSQKSMADAARSIKQVGTAAKTAMGGMAQHARAAYTQSRFLTKSVDELELRLKEVNRVRFGTVLKKEFREANQEARKLERQIHRLREGNTGGIGGRLAGWRKDFASQLPGSQLIQNPLSIAGGVLAGIGKVVKEGMSSQQDIAGLGTVVGKNARNVYFQMMKDAAQTPFSLDSFKGGTQALLSTGMDAKRVRADMLNLSNAVAAVGGGDDVLGRMAANLQQIRTVGQATAMDIRQFGMAGINIYKLLANATGKDITEVQKMTVTYDMLSNALASAGEKGGMYYHGLYNQTHTLAGRIKIMQSEFTIMIKQVGLSLQPYLQPIVDIAERIVHGITTLFTKFQSVAAPAIMIIGGLAAAILVAAAAQWAWNAAQLANPVTWIIVGVIALIAAIVYLIYKIDGWGKAWKNLVEMNKGIMAIFVDAVRLGWLYIQDYYLSGIEKIKEAWYKLQSLWDKDAANAGLTTIAKEGAKRATEIANQKKLMQSEALRVGKAEYDLLFNSFSVNKNVTFKGIKDKLKGQLGLNGSGQSVNGNGVGGNASNISSGVTSGGPKTITININKEMVGSLAVNSINVREGLGEIENMVGEILRRMLMSVAAG